MYNSIKYIIFYYLKNGVLNYQGCKAIDDVFDDGIEMIGEKKEKKDVQVIIANKTIYSLFLHWCKCVKLTVLRKN